jgi:signal transduction histidine kinase
MRVSVAARGPVSRRPVRLRLTLVYSGLFLLAGVVLLAVTYGLVAGTLPAKVPGAGASGTPLPLTSSDVKGFPDSELALLCKTGQATSDELSKCKVLAQAAYQSALQAGATTARANTLDHLLFTSLGGLAVTALLSAFLGWVVAGRALRPVHAITAAARRASEENLGERIALAGPPDELKDLADTFDAMLTRLDAAFTSQRRFVANASHELRTPLTVMRTAIDVTLAKRDRTPAQLEAMAIEVRRAAERAESLIEALLTLARSDRGPGTRSSLDVAICAEDALDAAAPAIRAASLRVTSDLAAAPATGDPVLVERLVANLVDNAVRHNAMGGWVEVSAGSRDGMAFLSVANGGPVIAEADVETLFEPFRRLRPGIGGSVDGGPVADGLTQARAEHACREGVGLGLSIVRSVVAAHHGKVTARAGTAGGLEVLVLLPAE